MEKRNNLILSISQQALISPSQRYSLAILEMSNIALLEHVTKALNENPFLIEGDTEHENIQQYHNYRNPALFLENTPNPCNPKEEILQQLAFLRLNNTQRKIAIILMDHVIEHNYIKNDILQKISKEHNISYATILKIIKKLQLLNPPALFSFNLQDKLKTLLEINGKYDIYHKMLIQNINSVLSHGTSILKEKYNFDELRLQKIITDVRNAIYDFESYFDNECCQYKIPDIFLENEPSINGSILPHISIDTDLYDQSFKKCKSRIDQKYIQEKLKSAKILIQSINNRNTTILKVVKEVVYRQYDFLFGNSSSLIPISIKSIANSLQLHESTINRAISNKTISTPKGIFELKFLMPRQIKASGHKTILSDHTVKQYIKNLVDNEPKNSPYTDNHIAYFLNSQGIEISRRTVSKYRNIMNIPNVSCRNRSYKFSSTPSIDLHTQAC